MNQQVTLWEESPQWLIDCIDQPEEEGQLTCRIFIVNNQNTLKMIQLYPLETTGKHAGSPWAEEGVVEFEYERYANASWLSNSAGAWLQVTPRLLLRSKDLTAHDRVDFEVEFDLISEQGQPTLTADKTLDWIADGIP